MADHFISTKLCSYVLIFFFVSSNLIAMNYTNGLDQKLLQAAEVGFVERIPILIKDGANKDLLGKKGNTPLHLAAINKHYKCIMALLENNANPNILDCNGLSPLYYTCFNNDFVSTQHLLINKANPNIINKNTETYPLWVAVDKNYSKIVKILLDAGANPNLMLGHFDNEFPLANAVFKDYLLITKMLLAAGATTDCCIMHSENYTTYFDRPLDLAIRKDKPEFVKILVEAKADTERTMKVNSSNVTPLFFAAMKGYHECLKILLSYGWACTEAGAGHFKPLHVAVAGGHIECVKALLASRANITAKDNKGKVPIDYATSLKIAELLQQWPQYLIDKQKVNSQYLAFFKTIFSPESPAYKLPVELHMYIYKFYAPPTLEQFLSKY